MNTCVIGSPCGGAWPYAQDGCTALIRAARNGHTECARLLLDAGAVKEAKDKVCIDGSPRGVLACVRGHVSARIHCLVSYSFSSIQDGTTALLYAAMNGHADCARLLLDAGADLETTDVVRGRRIAAFLCVTTTLLKHAVLFSW